MGQNLEEGSKITAFYCRLYGFSLPIILFLPVPSKDQTHRFFWCQATKVALTAQIHEQTFRYDIIACIHRAEVIFYTETIITSGQILYFNCLMLKIFC